MNEGRRLDTVNSPERKGMCDGIGEDEGEGEGGLGDWHVSRG